MDPGPLRFDDGLKSHALKRSRSLRKGQSQGDEGAHSIKGIEDVNQEGPVPDSDFNKKRLHFF
ncbi:hypothetical protein BGX26_009778 [Mortierella sp. AD094]|nr:hypothetical protein BGX26_009778 [Mortierella sp. AD094]